MTSTAQGRIEIGPALLWRIGFRNFTSQQVQDAVVEIYEALESAVGERLVAMLTNRQVDELDRLLSTPSEQRALAWIEKTVPSYRQIVVDEYDRLVQRLEGALQLSRRQHKGLSSEAPS